MASIGINSSTLGSSLEALLMADDLRPGDEPSYQLCKTIYLSHPLGAKMAEAPISLAQSQARDLHVAGDGVPEDELVEAFNDQWRRDNVDAVIRQGAVLARVYGSAAIVVGIRGRQGFTQALPDGDLSGLDLFFNVLDPLNTSGSFTWTQDPSSPDFQQIGRVSVQGKPVDASRSFVILNEAPVYLAYSYSAFGYVGRSVYQRALYPLKSFVQSMITDDLVTRKAGLLVAEMKQPGSTATGLAAALMGVKRTLLKEAKTNDVLSIAEGEKIYAIDLANVDGAARGARQNILENVAAANGMPAQLLNNETYAAGFGEGTEDAKSVARFIDLERLKLNPLYDKFDRIVARRAWSEDLYTTLADKYPEVRRLSYQAALQGWLNGFRAAWPNLLAEPESEKLKGEKDRAAAVKDYLTVMLPNLDPVNKAATIMWAADATATNPLLFPTPLVLDVDLLTDFIGEQAAQAEEATARLAEAGPLERAA